MSIYLKNYGQIQKNYFFRENNFRYIIFGNLTFQEISFREINLRKNDFRVTIIRKINFREIVIREIFYSGKRVRESAREPVFLKIVKLSIYTVSLRFS